MTAIDVEAPTNRRWWGFAALAAGLAMIVLDGTILGVALPAIIDEFDLALNQAQWITSLYSVVFAALLLTFGRLGDINGRRLVFLVGVVVFAAARLAAASAMDANELIGARCVQGSGGAMVLPAALSSLNATFRGRERAMAFGIWGAVMAGAAAIGPLLGGWLTTSFSWRWIFVVNLPVSVLVVALGLKFLPETQDDSGDRRFDYPGLVTSAVGLGLLVFGLIEGPSLGWFKPSQDFALLGLTWPQTAAISVVPPALLTGAVVIATFLLLERARAARGKAVLLDLSLFSVSTFAWGNLTATMVAVGEFALLFVLPLYLVFAMKLTIMQAGWVLAAMAVGAFVAGARARSLAAKLGAPRVVTVGLVLELVAAVVTAVAIGPAISVWLLAALMAVYGLGLGLASAQLTSTVLKDVPTAQSGVASATQSTVRQLGSALGAALAGTVLAIGFTITVPAQLALVPGVTADDGQTMIDYMTGTAGAVIVWIRDKGTDGHFGMLGPQVADALTIAFAQSISWVIWVAAGFIELGVIGARAVERAARAPAEVAPPTPLDAVSSS